MWLWAAWSGREFTSFYKAGAYTVFLLVPYWDQLVSSNSVPGSGRNWVAMRDVWSGSGPLPVMGVWRPLPSHSRGEETLIDKGMDVPKVVEVISLEPRLESISPVFKSLGF